MPHESSPLSDRKLTQGAVRILERVKAWAEQEANFGEFPIYRALLRELLNDENEASALLQLPASITTTIPVDADSEDQNQLENYFDWQMKILRHADRYAIMTSVEAMTGTEHLLLATLELDPWSESFLNDHGFELKAMIEQLETPEAELHVAPEDNIVVKPAGMGTIDQTSLHRILDASANRCREGLRVVEDFVRFALDEPFLSRQLKDVRHRLTEVLKHLRQETWLPARDTSHDVGTTVSTSSEAFRGSTIDVVRASMKRVEEALRSLEEYSKLIDSELSQRIESSRYTFYTIEKAIETNVNSRHRLHDRRLYLLVTADNCRYGIETTVRDSLAKGVDIVQLREKSLSDRELVRLGKQVRDWTLEQNAIFIMNDRPDLAVACGADGVHLGQEDMEVHAVRKVLGSGKLIGVSTHNLDQVHEAVYAGADYIGVGPTFPSQTKEFTEFAGLEFISSVAAETSLPWFAIGGIDISNVQQVVRAGATRIAVSSVICAAPDPRGVTRQLAEALRPHVSSNQQ